MAKFVTIGYGDEEGYANTDRAVLDAAHAHDGEMQRAGVEMGIAGSPVQVRNHDAQGVSTQDGAFLMSALPLAGFSLLEAESLEEAIEIVSKSPCAVAQGVIEIWPLQDAPS
ncbi:MAG: hypothetical protein ABIN55_01075 [Aeromicrobium sp.]